MSAMVEVKVKPIITRNMGEKETAYRGRIVETISTPEFYKDVGQYLQVPALIIEKQGENRELVVQPLKSWGNNIQVRRI